jgi:hypothetical protein
LKIGEGENIIDNGDTNDHFTTVPVTSWTKKIRIPFHLINFMLLVFYLLLFFWHWLLVLCHF